MYHYLTYISETFHIRECEGFCSNYGNVYVDKWNKILVAKGGKV